MTIIWKNGMATTSHETDALGVGGNVDAQGDLVQAGFGFE